jgi:pimeloyl-ACP methyl ester carboxylesterase
VHDALEEVAVIRAPMLITVGDADILTPPAHSRVIHEWTPGSTLHVWPEMGHAPFWEIPDAFNRLNLEFLEAH